MVKTESILKYKLSCLFKYIFLCLLKSVSVSVIYGIHYLKIFILFQACVASCNAAIRRLVSVKLFLDLHIANKKDVYGRIPIDLVTNFVRTKKDRINKMIGLSYYDSSRKGYLTPEVVLFLSEKSHFLQKFFHLIQKLVQKLECELEI